MSPIHYRGMSVSLKSLPTCYSSVRQPSPWTCLPTCLSYLKDIPVSEVLALSQDTVGWTLQEAIVVAYKLSMFVCPFMQSQDAAVFSDVYQRYPGILLGEQPAGHALAKFQRW